ncbi:MAG: hypothetical protein GX594_19420 [Pirellulaceae bacterium]|nr:hypothetical protein [Pirellulaceae bacterium]
MPDPFSNLKCLDMDALSPVFDELAGLEKDVARDFGDTRRHVTRTARAIMRDARRRQNAIDDISDLPQPGEVVHLLSAKRFALFNIVEAVLALRAPAKIRYLAICTLGFSTANVEGIAAMLDSRNVEQLDFVFSVYFKSLEKENCERLTVELGQRGARIIALLQHSKILLIETTTGDTYVVESSANLRSCASLEQTSIFNDADLFRFHKTWIDSLFTEAKK